MGVTNIYRRVSPEGILDEFPESMLPKSQDRQVKSPFPERVACGYSSRICRAVCFKIDQSDYLESFFPYPRIGKGEPQFLTRVGYNLVEYANWWTSRWTEVDFQSQSFSTPESCKVSPNFSERVGCKLGEYAMWQNLRGPMRKLFPYP